MRIGELIKFIAFVSMVNMPIFGEVALTECEESSPSSFFGDFSYILTALS